MEWSGISSRNESERFFRERGQNTPELVAHVKQNVHENERKYCIRCISAVYE